MKTMIPQGQMFIYFDNSYMEKPSVWVKVSPTIDDEPSLFIDNNACIRYTLNSNSLPADNERWQITDQFYGKMVREGKFVPIDDLNHASKITEQMGWPAYTIDLGF